MRPAAIPGARWRLTLLGVVLASAPMQILGQSITVRVSGDALHVRGATLGVIQGDVAARLRDGASIAVDIDLLVLDKAGGSAVAHARDTFTVSFDLWEQRFAATRLGAMPRSISHLTARDTEAWCLDNVTVPVSALGRFARDVPFWIRIDSRVHGPAATPDPDDDSTFTLRRLINVLSRRRDDPDRGRVVDAGPFRLTP